MFGNFLVAVLDELYFGYSTALEYFFVLYVM
jgi:hypothetical protein